MEPTADFVDTWARVGVKVAGTRIGIRREIDFVAGTGVTITGVDSRTGEKVTVTVSADATVLTDTAILASFLTMGAH